MNWFKKLRCNLSSAFTRSYGYTVVFVILCNMPIAIHRFKAFKYFNSDSSLFTVATEFSISVILVWIILASCSFNKYLFKCVVVVFFVIGGMSDFFIFNFSKTFDIGVLLDALSNEAALVVDFVSFELALVILLSVVVCLLVSKFRSCFKKGFEAFILIFAISSLLQTIYYFKVGSDTVFKSTVQSYLPSSVLSVFEQYLRKYKLAKYDAFNKKDISKQYSFNLVKPKQPLYVVLVIGESMRGDLLHINGYKEYSNTDYLEEIKSLISFKNASSTSSYTREAVPLILTRSEKGNLKQALEQTSIFSVFRKLGFETAWIGNQGLFADNDYSYGPIALEASYVISRSDIMREYPENNYDSLLLNFLDQYLEKQRNANHFIVLHMMGSHWEFTKRYPKDFSKFVPTCDNIPQRCSVSELTNSYHNTIVFSSYILNQVTERFKDKNTLLIFVSDHGFSLNEGGFFGNAANPAPKEQLNIAMFAWASNGFLAEHLNSYNKLKAKVNKPVGHYNIYHTLLGCAGVKSESIEQNLNLCN